MECIFFSSAHGTFSGIDHMLGHKVIPNKFMRTEIISNIFSDHDGVKLEIIDLNRIRFHKIGMEEGCRNFERLPGTDQMTRWMAQEYASKMGYNPDECFKIMNSCKEKV